MISLSITGTANPTITAVKEQGTMLCQGGEVAVAKKKAGKKSTNKGVSVHIRIFTNGIEMIVLVEHEFTVTVM